MRTPAWTRCPKENEKARENFLEKKEKGIEEGIEESFTWSCTTRAFSVCALRFILQ